MTLRSYLTHASWIAVSVWACCSWCTLQSQAPSGPIGEVRGRLTSCARTADAIQIEVSGQRFRLEVSGASRLPSDAYRRIVGNLYDINGSCPPNGTHLRVTTCAVCRVLSVAAVETGGVGEGFDGNASRLWIQRRFLDLAPPRPDDGFAVSVVSMVVARYNRRDGLRRQVWIRDVLGHALDSYSSPDRAYTFIQTFGSADLNAGVAALVEIARQHDDEVGVVRALPFLPADSRSAPFVGGWGTFATEVFLEGRDRTLTRLFGPTGGG